MKELHRGVLRHFPESGLSAVASEIVDVACGLEQRSRWIQPGLSFALRGCVGLVVAAIVGALIWFAPMVLGLGGPRSLAEFMEATESGFQLVLLLGAAIFFLVSLERRIVRRNALTAIDEVRSLVHVVDMHQLRKGPEHLRTAVADGVNAESTPDATELIRYLDYCSELLSMLSKMCAYCVQSLHDRDFVGAVQEVQVVSIGLSQKIWQKISILDAMVSSTDNGGEPIRQTGAPRP